MVKQIARNFFLNALGYFYRPSAATHFLNGHYVLPFTEKDSSGQKKFRNFLFNLSKRVDIISPAEALGNLNQKKRPTVTLTFDDGFQDIYSDIVPVLEELKIKAIFFVNPSFLDFKGDQANDVLIKRYKSFLKKDFLTSDQLQSISNAGFEIGSHTLTHERLNHADGFTIRKEIVESKEQLEKLTGKPCSCFAYPFGGLADISKLALDVSKKNYKYVFSSVRGSDLFTFDGQVINRRHFEGNWPVNHVSYFLSGRK